MRTRGWATTDVGLKRDHNEDSYLCNDSLSLYAVADGMGGHLGGERASRLAVEILEREIQPVIEFPARRRQGPAVSRWSSTRRRRPCARPFAWRPT